jgi:hypothetical protein
VAKTFERKLAVNRIKEQLTATYPKGRWRRTAPKYNLRPNALHRGVAALYKTSGFSACQILLRSFVSDLLAFETNFTPLCEVGELKNNQNSRPVNSWDDLTAYLRR